MGNLIYRNDTLTTAQHDEGIIKFSATGQATYQYFINDHLGSLRVIFQKASSNVYIAQRTDYYPFGGLMEGLSSSLSADSWKHLYQSKNYIDFNNFNTSDFGVRGFDNWLGRFNGIDPVVNPSISGFAGMLNNPLSVIDPDGRNPIAIGAFVGIFANTVIKMAQNKPINNIWQFLSPGIVGAVGGSFAANAPNAIVSSLWKNIGYGALSGAVTGGVSDIVNGGNGSGVLWGAVTGGAFAGINWGIDRSNFENSLHDITTALAKAGDPNDPIQLNTVVVRAPRNKFLDKYGKRAAVNGFFGNLSYFWTGGHENGISYDRQGYPYARAPITGAPDLIGGTAGGLYNTIKITGFTRHGLNRVIQRGIHPQSILDAVKNPLKIGEQIIDDLGRVSQRFVGRTSEVVINPQTGKVLSVNPTSSSKATRLLKQIGIK